MKLSSYPLVGKAPTADLAKQVGHALRVVDLAVREAVVELGQVAGQVNPAPVVVRAVQRPLELGEVAILVPCRGVSVSTENCLAHPTQRHTRRWLMAPVRVLQGAPFRGRM